MTTTKQDLLKVAALITDIANNHVPSGTGVLNSPRHYEQISDETLTAMKMVCNATQVAFDSLAYNLAENIPLGLYEPTETNDVMNHVFDEFIRQDIPDTEVFLEAAE